MLSRVVRWTDQGLEYEADPRNAELVVRSMQQKKGYTTPAVPERNKALARRTGIRMRQEDASCYRAIAARLNYLALDRPDIVYTTKGTRKVMPGAVREVGRIPEGMPEGSISLRATICLRTARSSRLGLGRM